MTFAPLLNAGIQHHPSVDLQKKLRITNTIALILSFGVAIPFLLISLVYFPPLTWIPVAGILISALAILLNYAGVVQLGRIIMATLPLMLAATYQVGLTGQDEPPVLGVHLIELSFFMIPFLVFSLQEKRYLIPITVVNTLIMMSYSYTSGWWEPALDSTIIREGYVGTIALAVSIEFTMGNVITLVQQNYLSEQTAARLLKQAQATNEKATQSEQTLKESLQQLQQAQQEEQQRQWVAEGLAHTAGILRQHDDLQRMGDRMVAYLVGYLKANQGGLFTVEQSGDQPYLRLQACYAYARKKHQQKTIAIGQGLVGQTYLEKKYTYLTNLPPNYITITSGLGETTPRALLIMPLISNEQVEGVLELASFQEFDPHQIRFVQTLGETIAATIHAMRGSIQTKQLLAESQQQAEEMRAQEEEMRQNMEELQATQDDMARVQAEMQSQFAAVNAATAYVEFSLEGHILTVNDLFMRTMRYQDAEQVIGQHHRIFVDPQQAKGPEYTAFWQALGQGKFQSGRFQRVAQDGTIIWLQATTARSITSR